MQISKREPQQDLKELIYSKLSEYDVIRYYVGGEFKFNMAFKSPLPGHRHGDRSSSFSVGASSSGRLIWKDHALDLNGGAIDLVQVMYGISYPQALQKICKDFYLMEGVDSHKKIVSTYQQPVIEARRSLIQVCTRKFTAEDLKWWGQYLITADDLKKEEVYAVKEYYINRQKQVLKTDELCYAYYYGDKGFKIYHPQRSKEEGKWKSSVGCDLVEGHLNGDAKVLITKSKKDRVVLQKITGYPVLNVQNEGMSGLTEEFRKTLGGKKVVISFDSDDAGVRNCKRICDMWKYSYVNTPRFLLEKGIKDWSDWVKYTGSLEPAHKFLKDKGIVS